MDKTDYIQGLSDYTYTKTNTRVGFHDLRVGEVYFRPSGANPVVVTDINLISNTAVVLHFCGTTDIAKPRFMWATSREPKETEKEESMTNVNKLYQIIGTETYGTHIATNSKGAYVLEMKGSGEVVTRDKTDLEEVVPYTIGVKFLDNGGRSREYSYFSKEGEVSVGDLILINGDLASVNGVNTKSGKATKDLVGNKIMTTKIGEEV